MLLKNRVIPCLLLSDSGLVKTCKFANPKYVGDPINAIRIFNEKEVDELMVLDITASRERREPDYDLIEQFAGECFMPLAYGGGIRTVEQARRLFSLGVEKICLQTAALEDATLISRLANQFGGQSVMVSIDIKKDLLGRYKLYTAVTGKTLPVDWISFMIQTVQFGAGEVLLNAVDRDGIMEGADLTMIKKAAALIDVPLIACGGIGSLADIKAAVDAGASAVAAGAFFVFHGPHRAVLITYPSYNDLKKLLMSI